MIRNVSILYFILAIALSRAAAADLPNAFDLRDVNGHSYIGSVKDQGDCGGCYAFGAMAAAESTYNRAMGLYDDEAVDLSESFIIWTLSQYYEGIKGCDGSSIDYEELTGILNYGVVTESVYPYSTTDPGEENDHLDSASTLFSEWYRIPPNDIETMKRIIHTFGALDGAVEVDYAFDQYEGGIFSNSTRSVEDVLAYTAYTNHAISLVGWNDEGGTWILRNSWGEAWGEDGYMYIDYTSANVALEAAYLIVGDWPGHRRDLRERPKRHGRTPHRRRRGQRQRRGHLDRNQKPCHQCGHPFGQRRGRGRHHRSPGHLPLGRPQGLRHKFGNHRGDGPK